MGWDAAHWSRDRPTFNDASLLLSCYAVSFPMRICSVTHRRGAVMTDSATCTEHSALLGDFDSTACDTE